LSRGGETRLATTSRAFFFSSRRRHTRFSRDWSSDVCSSDLLFGESLGDRPDPLRGGTFVCRAERLVLRAGGELPISPGHVRRPGENIPLCGQGNFALRGPRGGGNLSPRPRGILFNGL